MKDKLSHVKHLLHKVEKVPSEELLPGYEFTKQQAYAIVVHDGKKRIVVNHCSEQYNLVPNAQVIEPIVDILGDRISNIEGSSRYNSRFQFTINLNTGNLITVGSKKDPLIARMLINNSYDGRVRYSYEMGLFRQVCSNGLTVPVENTQHVRVKMRHTPGLDEFVEPTVIIDMVNNFSENLDEFVKPFNELSKKKVKSVEERINEVIEETGFPSRRAEDIFNRLNHEVGELKTSPNDWLIYNAFNYQLNHSDDIQMDAHKKDRLDSKVLLFLIEN